MEANSKEVMAEWVLAIDGLCMPSYSTHLNAQFRVSETRPPPLTLNLNLTFGSQSELLLHMYKNVYKGGVIKSSYEDEWSYFANGTLERVEPVNGRKLIYSWDGEVLQPVRVKSDEEPPSYGVGRWNGVWLTWYRQDYLLEEPLMRYFLPSWITAQQVCHHLRTTIRYLWVPSEKEFQTSNPLLTWKWTRHFLACKHGSGEWIMEGEVHPSARVLVYDGQPHWHDMMIAGPESCCDVSAVDAVCHGHPYGRAPPISQSLLSPVRFHVLEKMIRSPRSCNIKRTTFPIYPSEALTSVVISTVVHLWSTQD